MKKDAFCDLYTWEGETLPEVPWNSYPRPQMQRAEWINLNGMWEFSACEEELCPVELDRKIRVPFSPESLLSGVHEVFSEKKNLFYRREFTLPAGFRKDRVLLHVGAADQEAAVWVNDRYVGSHVGGYQPFSFDITEFLEAENTVVIRVRDHLSEKILPYGKQCRKRGGMWYTPVSGI